MLRMRWLLLVLIALALVAGCSETATATPIIQYIVVTATPAPATVNLVLQSQSGTRTLTLEELKALPVTEGWAGIKSSTGKITPPAYYKGVSLRALCEVLGPFDSSMAANVVAKDGYGMTMSYDQITGGTFTTFDPATGDEVTTGDRLTMVVAYERDGLPMSEESDGSLRLVIVGPNKDQVTDGHWSVKWVEQVVVKPAAADWTLHLEGALVEDMDRNTFESGAAPNCHLSEWTDAEGNTWGGIPLYYLMGRVDDENKHESGAYSDALAKQGYLVDVVAADGYKVSFDSQRLSRDKTIILAYMMNGAPLEDKYFPLRLVGAGLQKNEMVGAVAQVVLHVEDLATPSEVTPATEAATLEPTSETPGAAPEATSGTLHIWGKVEKATAITQAEYAQMESVQITAEHPKKGKQDYIGVRLNDLLQQARPADDASAVLFTAGDGYSIELPWATVAACADCLATFDGEAFGLVMPGQESSAWVKDVRLIEVK